MSLALRSAVFNCAFAALLSAQAAPPRPTAVFTLDARHQTFYSEPDSPIDAQFAEWALQCKAEPGGDLYVLRCPAVDKKARGVLTEDPSNEVTVSLVLLRDLQEAIYLAGCPLLEELSSSEAGSQSPRQNRRPEIHESEEQKKHAREQNHRDCLEVAAGQTFSTEVEEQILNIVFRGRQLSLTVFGMQPKARSIDTPYEPAPSRTGPSISPPNPADSLGIPPQTQPEWHPPDLSALSSTTRAASLGAPAGLAGAKTSLRTGRFMVACSSSRAQVFVDETYVGVCPIDMPLVAGPHVVEVRGEGQRRVARGFRIDAGEIVKLTIRGGRFSFE